MKTVLLLGDSVTDCGRNRENDDFTGHGYAGFIRAELGKKYGDKIKVLNRGINGNRVLDLLGRVKWDVIREKPDYISILIGMNDAWHEYDWENSKSVSVYKEIYSLLIEIIKEGLPDTKICILEPFVLKYKDTCDTEENPNRWKSIRFCVERDAKAAREVAEQYNLPFIYLQNKFDSEAQKLGISTVTIDGVHPTPTGHIIIAEEWMKVFKRDFLGE